MILEEQHSFIVEFFQGYWTWYIGRKYDLADETAALDAYRFGVAKHPNVEFRIVKKTTISEVMNIIDLDITQ